MGGGDWLRIKVKVGYLQEEVNLEGKVAEEDF